VKTETSLLYAFRDGRHSGGNPVSQQKREKKAGEEEALFCKSCSHRITRRDHAISINGSHTHTFFNPAGIVFELGCFSDASGSLPAGEATSEFTWFAGYQWRFVLCGRCRFHLGWHYETAESGFFGLILACLI